MNEQDRTQKTILQRPANDDKEAWKAYWKVQDQTWRTEPEIDPERQKYLAERRAITPDMEKGISPFRGISLSRVDIEWLLATHENGLGPVNWNDENQRKREGLDLGGADVRNINLRDLPLSCMKGFSWSKVTDATNKQIETVVIDLEGANLQNAHLEGAMLMKANLSRVDAYGVHLEEAQLFGASLEDARLDFSHLEKTGLIQAQLGKASLKGTHLEGANIAQANLAGAMLCNVFFDRATQLDDVVLTNKQCGSVRIVDVRWGDVNLAVMKWSQVEILGDEHVARQKMRDGVVKEKSTRLEEYEIAIRANRQLSTALQYQGLNENAAHFAYRAQLLQCKFFLYQRKFAQYLGSLFLDLLAGYGYRPIRSILWYLVIIFGFAFAYYAFGRLSLFPPDAFVYSLTSFHGRGFFPGLENRHSLHDPLVMLAAIEAVVGLFIEISFIATFTKRFFGS